MKIDRRKKYYMVLDVETANTIEPYNDGLVYDLGFVIIDKKGNIYAKRSFCIKEIFSWRDLMKSAYYVNKLPKYYKSLKNGTIEFISIWEARKRVKEAIKYFDISEVYAYNANFDITTLNNTVRFLSGSACRYFLPYGIKVCDIWNIACQILGTQKTFQKEGVTNEKGNLITSAERMYAYITQQHDFEEQHTGLADALIEGEILTRCLKSHKKINKGINRLCWKIPQQAF